jgi:hypothetical protein
MAEPFPAPLLDRSQSEPAQLGRLRHVTLVFGIPLTLDEFMARLDARTGSSDFLAKFDDRGLEGEELRANQRRWWTSRYEPNVAQPLTKLALEAVAMGCAIRRRATIRDLAAAARDDAIVIVISHWKGPEFSNDDFLPNFDDQLAARLAAVDHPLAIASFQLMRPRRGWLPFTRRHPLRGRDAVRQALDTLLQDQEVAGDIHHELDATRRARRRDLLDEWLRGLVRPGNRLELFDGLHPAAEISHAIPALFTGVLDLTVCTSTYLGDRLGHAAAQRFRTVQFVAVQDLLEAAIRISLTLRFFATVPELSYLQARAEVSKGYPKVVEHIARHVGKWGESSDG